eukprot:gene20293-8542_t
MSTGEGDAGAAASASPFPGTAAAEAVEYQSTLGDVPPWMSPTAAVDVANAATYADAASHLLQKLQAYFCSMHTCFSREQAITSED